MTKAQSLDKARFAASILKAEGATKTLIESFAEALVVVDQEGKIVMSNGRARQLFSDGADLAGRPLGALLPEDVAEGHGKHIGEYFRNPRVRPMGIGVDLRARRLDGTVFPVEISLSFLDTEIGRVALAFVSDISRRKATEERLEAQNRLLDQFAGFVAHDLQSSAAAIKLIAQQLGETHAWSEEQESRWVDAIVADSDKMISIIDGLLLLVRADASDVPMDIVHQDRVIGGALHRLKSRLVSTKVRVVIEDEPLPSCLGRTQWLEEIWYNLISNVCNHAPGSTATIRARRSGSQVEYSIHDTGPGIPPSLVTDLFNPVPSGNGTRRMGIGLMIVGTVVERLNGFIGVDSDDSGTTFRLTLTAGPDEIEG